MLKVIYFDESSALDSLDQANKGRIQEITKDMVDKANELSGEAEFEARAKTSLFTFFKLGGGIDTKGQFSRKGTNILTTTLTNTILTSFIELLETDFVDSESFETVEEYKLKIVPDSFTFLKTITPFIKVYSNQADVVVVQSGNENANDPQNFDFSLFDDVLENAKGYYELLAVRGDDRKIVRFNLDGLRNNYRLTDLQKMDLTIHGIKVGTCTEKELHFMKEIGESHTEETSSGFDAFEQEKKDNFKNGEVELDIIDVILAGIN
ncbi:hypothetical protein I7V34_21095 [Bacillus sp. V3]|nr:hypothetical protein I7V34_21095 [Bacillus sp. V3]